LGLAISRVLVELHGGKIFARSAGRGQGATFIVSLPVIKKPAHLNGTTLGVTREETAGANRNGLRLLLVEDHETTRVTIDRLLTRRGYIVQSAACCTDALRLAEMNVFDFVISDIGLPDDDGYVLMKELRQRYELRGVALTGYGMVDDIERARAAGFVAHLTKPVDVHQLAAVLKQWQPEKPAGH
jgi:CheY-like chemotaxis protein